MTLRFPQAIFAVDPGGSVGFARLEGSPMRPENYAAWIVKLGPWPEKGDPSKDPALEVVREFGKVWGPKGLVLCERFTTAQRQNRYGHFTVELIGAIEGVCYAYGVPFVPVMNKARRDYTAEAERRLGRKHNPNHDDDDVSSLAHLLAFIARAQRAIARQQTEEVC